MNSGDAVLRVQGLRTYFPLEEGTVKAVDGADFAVSADKTVCIVGESGCGKSVTAHSILQVIDPPGRIVGGQILFRRRMRTENNGQQDQTADVIDLAALKPRSREMRHIRGNEIAMIFQEPMTALSPVHTIGDQIVESILLHLPSTRDEARERTVALLRRVGIPEPETHIDSYTFQLSGGMRQRAMIAMALACNPTLLIADEPTTALDVTTQARILELVKELQQDYGMAVMYITHDLGVVAEIADDVVIMYLGQTVETGSVEHIFHDPQHPYTMALLRSIPKLGLQARTRLKPIEGVVPHPYNRPRGCFFGPRCKERDPATCAAEPPLVRLADGRSVRCWMRVPDGIRVMETE